MNLYKRGSVWWVEYQHDGIRHRQSTHTSKRTEAERWLNAIKQARQAPSFDAAVEILKILYSREASAKIALSDAWATYERVSASIGKQVGATTLRKRRIALAAFAKWISNTIATAKSVEDVTSVIAARYAEHLLSLGKKSKTRINIISDLSTIWSVLAKSSDALTNPWLGLRPTDTDGKRLPAFTREDEEKVLQAAREVGDDWFAVCVIARHTGLRYGDIACLTWSEIDFNAKTIRLKPRKTLRHGIAVAIPMVDEVLEVLWSIRKDMTEVFPIHARRYGICYHGWGFAEILARAGLTDKGYTFHSWRHTAATRLAESGATKDIRKAILGHTTDENAERYDHAEYLQEKLAALNAAR